MPEAAVIYARTSSPNQRNNFSIDGQISECWTYAENRGWNVKYVYIDECESAKTTERPKFLEMIDRARTKSFNAIVFWKLDRFCRSLADLVNLERNLRSYGVTLSSATEFIDTSTSIGRFNFRNLANVAEFERELIGERSRLGLYVMAQEAKWPNSSPPLGYDRDKTGRLVPNKEEASIVNNIFSRYLEVKSMARLAYDLNRQGIRNRDSKTKMWSAGSLHDVLSNRIYIGDYNVASFSMHVEQYRLIPNNLFELVTETRRRYQISGAKRETISGEMKEEQLKSIFNQYEKFLESLAN